MVISDLLKPIRAHGRPNNEVGHGFGQADSINNGKSQLKLEGGSYAFLSAAANTDPQGSTSTAEACAIKCVTIKNNQNKINLNY